MTTVTSSENSKPLEPATSDGIAPVGFREAFMIWLKIGLLSFGGPAGQIATMHRILVEEKRWIGENRFLHALNFCMLLPGPEAQQLAVYVGWLLHRTAGGLVAGVLFVLPGAVVILALSFVYAVYQETTYLQAGFFGIKAAVLAVVLAAVLRHLLLRCSVSGDRHRRGHRRSGWRPMGARPIPCRIRPRTG